MLDIGLTVWYAALPCMAAALVLIIRAMLRFFASDCDVRTAAAVLDGRRFHSRVVWITGASGGLGHALCHLLARHGALLILSGRNRKSLETLAQSLPCPSNHVYILPFDFNHSSASHLSYIASQVPHIFGRLDLLLNNAGVSTRAAALEVKPEVIEQILRLNLVVPVILAQACVPALTANPASPGIIVNTLSIAALFATPLRAPYGAAKAAAAAYFDALRLELALSARKQAAQTGHPYLSSPSLRVLNVYPGSIKTGIACNALTFDGKPYGRSAPNIEAGLHPDRVADRILAAVSANNIEHAIIARPKELMMTRLATWFPSLWPRLSASLASTSEHYESYRRQKTQ